MAKVSNEQHKAEVVRQLYSDATKLGWQHLSSKEKTDQYARWLDDESVGGVLTQWMSPEEARVWIKDGPMKEFARALAGLGAFAAFLNDHPRGPRAVIHAALGNEWRLVEGSDGGKPLHCEAERGVEKVRLVWGPEKDFKHLLWAALTIGDDCAENPTLIVVYDTISRPVTRHEREFHERLVQRCGLGIKHVRLR